MRPVSAGRIGVGDLGSWKGLGRCFRRAERHATIQRGKHPVQRDFVQRFFHGRIGVPGELLQPVNAQHHINGKRRVPRLGPRRLRRNRGPQLEPRNDLVHLVHEFAPALELGYQLDSGACKAYLLRR